VEEPINDGTIGPGGGPESEAPREAENLAPEPIFAAPPVWRPAFERERNRRRALLRRLGALLGTGTLAFTVTTWFLLRHESRTQRPAALVAATVAPNPDGDGDTAKDPAATGDEAAATAALRAARAQLDALNQDDIAGAYARFSPRYRARVPLATFRKLIAAHRDMFHTEEQNVKTRSRSDDRVVLDIHLSSDDDEDYVAEFTMVRLQGRWCVDDLRWALEENDTHSSA